MERLGSVLSRPWKIKFGVHFDGSFGPPEDPSKIDLEAETVHFVRNASSDTPRMIFGVNSGNPTRIPGLGPGRSQDGLEDRPGDQIC